LQYLQEQSDEEVITGQPIYLCRPTNLHAIILVLETNDGAAVRRDISMPST